MFHILYIDDDENDLNAAKEALSKDAEIIVTGARSIESARTYAQRLDIDLIVLDVKMKESSGLALLKELRMNGVWTPACLYTTIPASIVNEVMDGYNCLTYIGKSSGIESLVPKVKDLLKISSREGIEQLDKIEQLALKVQDVIRKSSKHEVAS